MERELMNNNGDSNNNIRKSINVNDDHRERTQYTYSPNEI